MKNKIYVLKSKAAPLSFILASRNTHRKPLLHFDGKTNRALRYASNQKSPFEDEQDGNAILEPVVFENGFLTVPETNPVLQKFLELHPGNGQVFEEVNTEKNAQAELDIINYEVDALIAAKQMDISTMETVARVYLGSRVDSMTTAEIKRDVLMFAKRNPQAFLESIEDSTIEIQDLVARLFNNSLLSLRNKNKEVYYNLPNNKKKLINVPYGEDPRDVVLGLLIKDEEVMNALEKQLKKIEV
jgi:hypothetical protein|tara:strand:+ start:1235 stop:1963 length:729 start_codon:yes stop_codon:yes gene_type:complete